MQQALRMGGYYGGIIARFDTIKTVRKDHLNGLIDSIPELEEERLSLRPDAEGSLLHTFRWRRYSSFVAVGDFKQQK